MSRHSAYILDDGRRAEVKALAMRMGCRYLTRSDNRHAKAGNFNAALLRAEGDFIVILDADTIPQPDFLGKTLGYFVDERVALVQLPQEFYNLDSVQHIVDEREFAPWYEQSLFYQVIQAGKNHEQRRLSVRFLPLEPAEREPLTAFLFVTAVREQWARRNELASAMPRAAPARPLPRVG